MVLTLDVTDENSVLWHLCAANERWEPVALYTNTEDVTLQEIAESALQRLQPSFHWSPKFRKLEKNTPRDNMSSLNHEDVKTLVAMMDAAEALGGDSEECNVMELTSVLAEMMSRAEGITVSPSGSSAPTV